MSLSLVLVLITSCKKQLFSSWGRHAYHVHILNLICEQAIGLDSKKSWGRKKCHQGPPKFFYFISRGTKCHCINPTESQRHIPSDGPPWDLISENVYSNEWRGVYNFLTPLELCHEHGATYDVSFKRCFLKSRKSVCHKKFCSLNCRCQHGQIHCDIPLFSTSSIPGCQQCCAAAQHNGVHRVVLHKTKWYLTIFTKKNPAILWLENHVMIKTAFLSKKGNEGRWGTPCMSSLYNFCNFKLREQSDHNETEQNISPY